MDDCWNKKMKTIACLDERSLPFMGIMKILLKIWFLLPKLINIYFVDDHKKANNFWSFFCDCFCVLDDLSPQIEKLLFDWIRELEQKWKFFVIVNDNV